MNTNAEFGLSSIGQIAVTMHDQERATAFYRDVLGMKHLFSVPRLSFFDCGGIRLMLDIPEDPQFDHPSSIIYFRVADIHAAHEELGRRGVTFESGPAVIASLPDHDLWMAFFRDSEQNLLALMAEVLKQGHA